MTRINDRSNTENPIEKPLTNNLRKDDARKLDPAEFERKMAMQKKTAEQASKTNNRLKEPPPSKSLVKEKKQPRKEPITYNQEAKVKSKTTEKKESLKKGDAKAAKTEKKRDDILLDKALKQKQDQENTEDFSDKGSDNFFQASVNMFAQPLTKTSETEKAGAPPQIPDEVLNQMVDQIFVGTDAKGLSQFVIELKDSFLGGGQINVLANAGRIQLKFSGLNASSKTLLRNSKQALIARLRGKKLTLDAFDIV